MYFYFFSQKINAQTGAVTTICLDPLCEHTVEVCPTYGIYKYGSPAARYGTKIMFFQTVVEEDKASPNPLAQIRRSAFSTFDLLTNKVTRHYLLPQKQMTSYKVYNEYVFLVVEAPPEDIKNPTAEDFITQTMIINTDTGDITSCPNVAGWNKILLYDGSTIYYADYADKYHMLDVSSGEDVIAEHSALPEAARKETFYTYTEEGTFGKNEEGEMELLLPGVQGTIRVGDRLVYPVIMPEHADSFKPFKTPYHYFDLWTSALDGTDQKLVFDNPGNIAFYQGINQDAQIAGNYIGMECVEYTTNDAGEKVLLHSVNTDGYASYLIIDMTTGEYKTVAVEQIGEKMTTAHAQ
ncbi:MAG: hypothetical protein IJA85_02330 [Clostridia bacterium]|nr:hypothetical protein [Clostridia bacterium]